MALLYIFLRKRYKQRHAAQDIDELTEDKQHNESPLHEHQLSAANATAENRDAVIEEKGPTSDHTKIPAEKRDAKNSPESIAEAKRARVYRWKLILSLLIPNMMASMDTTITATAMPIIASHFSKRVSFNSYVITNL